MRVEIVVRVGIPRWVIMLSAGLAPVLVTGAWLVAGARQPASYSPFRQTVSALAGQGAVDPWIMTLALYAVGGCYLITAAGLTELRPLPRVLLAAAGLCSVGVALSPEPRQGPTVGHLAWTVLGAIIIAVWPAFTGRRLPLRPVVLTLAWANGVTLLFVAMLCWVLVETQGGSALGLAERLTVSVQTAWPFVVAVALRGRRAEHRLAQPAREHVRHG
jgi:hypothetical membrane protein